MPLRKPGPPQNAHGKTPAKNASQAPLHIILYEPEIPPNTGNIMRLCANSGAHLHLVEPLGFSLEGKRLRRAGLDYRDLAQVCQYANWEACLEHFADRRIFALSTHGETGFFAQTFAPGDALLFGPETRGLPAAVRTSERITGALRLPMRADSRSLNLSNAVAVCTYEVLRQLAFPQLS
jgi:tRNA (cytidine/uridine-2'-O-)-methyltransferase